MKKIFCLLAIIAMMTSVSAYADQHMEMTCKFNGPDYGRTESIDLFEQDNRIIAVSTLFPEYAVEIGQDIINSLSGFNIICSISPEKIYEKKTVINNLFHSWIERKLSDRVYGIYAGELFDYAAVMRYAEVHLSELSGIIRDAVAGETAPDTDKFRKDIYSFIADLFEDRTEDMDLKISIASYDEGRYVSAMIMNNEDVKTILSADFSDENETRLLIGYREEGRYYFRDISILYSGKKDITITSSLRSGEESSYHNLSGNRPLFTETLILSDDMNRYELKTDSVSEPLIVSGTASVRDNGQAGMNAIVRIGDQDRGILDISIDLENMARPVSLTDKQVVHLTDNKVNAEVKESVSTHIMLLAAEIIPTLPADYQKMMITWMYP